METKRRVPKSLRRRVRERAHGRCEYCLLHDEDATYPHEADHVIAERHGGLTEFANLAWACFACNHFKGTDLTSIDPLTGHLAALYDPRQHHWERHFRLNGGRIEPLTINGRTTVTLLHLNDPERIARRTGLIEIGRYPRG
ncbi:MAG: HNH endonuclease [Ktedonobacterales bacterium]